MIARFFRNDLNNVLGLLLICAVVFGFGLGRAGLLDPDEPFYSLTAKEMVQQNETATPLIFGQPQFEKPILFYSILYFFFKLMGVTELSSRMGPFFGGILTVLVTYLWGRVLFRRKAPALVSALVLATGAQFLVLSRIVLTDMYLCLFVTAALCAFSIGLRFERWRSLAWHAMFLLCALGFLTKGPLGILLPFFGIVSYLLWSRQGALLARIPWVTGLLIFAFVGFPWYIEMTCKHGTWFLKHFFIHENVRRFFVAEHKNSDKIFFYPLVILGGFFPWSAVVPFAMWSAFKEGFRKRVRPYQRQSLFLALSFLLPLIFFTAAKSKLMSYIFPVFPVVALMTGGWLYRSYRRWRSGSAAIPASIRAMACLIFGVLPVALVVGLYAYDVMARLGIDAIVTVLALAIVPLNWLALRCFLKKRFVSALTAVVVMVMAFAAIAFSAVLPAVDDAFSSRIEAGLYRRVAAGRPGLIMASKLFVRGVCYYTGNEHVSVIAE
ncbi:MAG: glycosyltransferase family 39 protein, partial [Candidatus Omnitrophota bacterium]